VSKYRFGVLPAVATAMFTFLTLQAAAQSPAAAGLSAAGVRNIDTVVNDLVAKGTVPGAVVLVARHGQVGYLKAFGVSDAQNKQPLKTDTIFWMASMTKPIVGAAVMMLVEEGKLQLADPVSRYVPSFRQNPRMVRVFEPGAVAAWQAANAAARRGGGGGQGGAAAAGGAPAGGAPAAGAARAGGPAVPPPSFKQVPANREITIRDLLTHTSGIQPQAGYPPNPTLPAYTADDTMDSFIPTLSRAAIDFQPGTQWAYSNAIGFDILAYIVQTVSGVPFDRFAKERIFTPLNMKDAGWGSGVTRQGQALMVGNMTNPCVNGTKYICGSAGLWMTATDYGNFAQMLENGGTFNGKRLLKRETVAEMATNHTGTLMPDRMGMKAAGTGMGLSMMVITDPEKAGVAPLPKGSFGWDGVGSRRFWVVNSKDMVIVMLLPGGQSDVAQRAIEKAALAAATG